MIAQQILRPLDPDLENDVAAEDGRGFSLSCRTGKSGQRQHDLQGVSQSAIVRDRGQYSQDQNTSYHAIDARQSVPALFRWLPRL
jgi:hypothetical protein